MSSRDRAPLNSAHEISSVSRVARDNGPSESWIRASRGGVRETISGSTVKKDRTRVRMPGAFESTARMKPARDFMEPPWIVTVRTKPAMWGLPSKKSRNLWSSCGSQFRPSCPVVRSRSTQTERKRRC